MGLFDFLKGGRNKLEYEGKQYEWFLTEDGKQSFLKYAVNWRDEDAYLVKIGAWEHGFFDLACMAILPNGLKPNDSRKDWPCFYIRSFLEACRKKYKKEKNMQVYRGLNVFNICLKYTGVLLHFLSLMVPEDLNELKWPDFLTPEGNPMINYIYNLASQIPENESITAMISNDQIIVSILYIHELAQQNIDVSSESWLYDINTSYDYLHNRKRTKSEIYEIALQTAKFPEDLGKRISLSNL